MAHSTRQAAKLPTIKLVLDEAWRFERLELHGVPGSTPIHQNDGDIDDDHFLALFAFGLTLLAPETHTERRLETLIDHLSKHADQKRGTGKLLKKRSVTAFRYFAMEKDGDAARLCPPFWGEKPPRDIIDFARSDPWRVLFVQDKSMLQYRPGIPVRPRFQFAREIGGECRDLDLEDVIIAAGSILNRPSHAALEHPGDTCIDQTPTDHLFFPSGSVANISDFGFSKEELSPPGRARAILIQYSGVNVIQVCGLLSETGWSMDLWIADPSEVTEDEQRDRIAVILPSQIKHIRALNPYRKLDIRFRYYHPDLAGPRIVCVPGIKTAFSWYLNDTLHPYSTINGHSAPVFGLAGPLRERRQCEFFVAEHLHRLVKKGVKDNDGRLLTPREALDGTLAQSSCLDLPIPPDSFEKLPYRSVT